MSLKAIRELLRDKGQSHTRGFGCNYIANKSLKFKICVTDNEKDTIAFVDEMIYLLDSNYKYDKEFEYEQGNIKDEYVMQYNTLLLTYQQNMLQTQSLVNTMPYGTSIRLVTPKIPKTWYNDKIAYINLTIYVPISSQLWNELLINDNIEFCRHWHLVGCKTIICCL